MASTIEKVNPTIAQNPNLILGLENNIETPNIPTVKKRNILRINYFPIFGFAALYITGVWNIIS